MDKHIIALKLRTGEVILGEFIDQTKGDYTVLDPIQLHLKFRESESGEYAYNYPTLYFPFGVDNTVTFLSEDIVTVDMATEYYAHIYLESLRMCIESEEKKTELLKKVLENVQNDPKNEGEKPLDNDMDLEYNESMPADVNEAVEDGYYGYTKHEDGSIKSFMVPNKQTKH